MVKRHDFNENMINSNVSYFKSKIDRLETLLTKRPENAGNLFQQAYEAIGDALVSEEDKETTKKILKIAKDLGLDTYRNAQATGKISLKVLDDTFEVDAVQSKAYIDPINWSKYFYTALLSRDRKAINELLEVPESLMREAQLKCDEVDFAIVRFLKGLYQSNADLSNLLKEALELTDPKENDSGRADYLLYLKFPELNLYRIAFSNNEKEFNDELQEALELHKKFWSDSKNANASEGWIAIPLLCVCLVANNSKGYTIDVESDYLPHWMFTS